MMNKTTKTLLISFIIIIVVVAFVVIRILMLGNNFDESSFKISELTEGDIVSEYNSCSAWMTKLRATGNDSGVKNSRFEDVDMDKVTYSSKKITGIETVSATRIKSGSLTIGIESKLTSGNAKIVIVQDDKILEYVEFGEKKTLSFSVDGEHVVYVKILCELAEVEITVEREM